MKRCWSGGFADQGTRPDGRAMLVRRDVVAAVAGAVAVTPLLFDVGELAAGSHLAIAPQDTSARERGETEEPDETHWCPRKARPVIRVHAALAEAGGLPPS